MKYYSVALLAVLSFNLNAQQKSKSTRISGTYTQSPVAGEKVYLTTSANKETKTVQVLDSAIVKNNQFTFKGKNIMPGKYELKGTKGKSLVLYLDYGDNKVQVNSSFADAKVLNNTVDSLAKQYEGMNTMMAMSQMAYGFKAMGYEAKGQTVPKSEEDQFVEEYNALAKTHKDLTRSLVLRKDMVSAYVLTHGGDSEFNPTEMNAIYKEMSAATKASNYGIKFKTFIDQLNSLAIGVKAPDFVQKTTTGADLRLSDFVKGKKLVLIDFWASWCGPCRKENPHVVALHKEFKDKGFDVLGVSLDTKEADWLKAIADDGLTWTQVSDLGGWKNSVAKLYNVTAVPLTVLVDGNGKIVAKNLRGEALSKKVAELCK